MSWWQLGVMLLPWAFERLWTIRGLKKVPKQIQKTVETAAQIAVSEALQRHGVPAVPPPHPAAPHR